MAPLEPVDDEVVGPDPEVVVVPLDEVDEQAARRLTVATRQTPTTGNLNPDRVLAGRVPC